MPPLDLVDTRTTLLLPLFSTPGAEAAWRVLVNRYWPRIVVWAGCGGVGRDDAEEIAAQVLLKLSCGPALASFEQGRARFRSWLQKVVHRAALDFRRHEQKIPGGVGRGGDKEDPLDALLDPAGLDNLTDDLDRQLAHDLAEAEAIAERVRARVKPSTWKAYYRTAIEKEESLEVAHELGIAITAVYQARHRVQAMLEKAGKDLLS